MGGAFYLYAECFEPTLTWGDGEAFRFIEIMEDFFAGMHYWEMRPHHALVNSGTLCLENPGREYVVYRQYGGPIVLDLSNVEPGTTFNAEWMDPRCGITTSAGTIKAGAKRSFNCPDGRDWVLHLTRADAQIK
jgi:hypothetical protein